jgi:1-acyl-sn-glycerol-3-phosphate acyltransferase
MALPQGHLLIWRSPVSVARLTGLASPPNVTRSESAMLFIRSFIFQIVYVTNNALWFVLCLPSLLLPFDVFRKQFNRRWGWCNIWLFETIIGARHEVRGLEHVPKGAALVACKHLSAWETVFLSAYLDQPSFILKRQLMKIPLLGLYLKKMRSIPIDRDAGVATLVAMGNATKEALALGQQVVIFPEGTRRPLDADPEYKTGVALLYSQAGVACSLIAHNSGLCWPRKGLLKYPGTIIIEFLPAIPASRPKKAFLAEMTERIEVATSRLVAEGRGLKLQDPT